MVKINGKSLDVAGKTITQYLQQTDYVLQYIAVEQNGNIIPKSTYDEVVLKDGDTLEIVSFVGGGWWTTIHLKPILMPPLF